MRKSNHFSILACVLAVLLLCVTLLPLAPTKTATKYVKELVLTDKITVAQNYYSVTYYNGDDTVFEVVNEFSTNTHALRFTSGNETNSAGISLSIPQGATFTGWVNAFGETPDLTHKESIALFPSFSYSDVTYTIRFMAMDGKTLLHSHNFSSADVGKAASSLFTPPTPPDLTAQDLQFSNWIVSQEGTNVAEWDSFRLPAENVVVVPVYAYIGAVGLRGIDSDNNGTIDYYVIVAVDDLPQNVEVPGMVNGTPVTEVQKLYSGSGTDGKLNQKVQTISLGEGIQIIRSKALAATPNLAIVTLPSTLTTIEGTAFAINPGQEKGKIVRMEYNGTKAQWDAVNKAGDWAKGLAKGSTVVCLDGTYTMTSGGGNPSWSWTANN